MASRIAAPLAVIAAAFAVAIAPRPVAACGGGGVTSTSSGVVANAQRIFMSVRAATTDIVVEIGVPATSADWGALIPTPAEPTLDAQPISEADLAALDAATAPTILVSQPGGGSDDGCGCPFVAGTKANSGGGSTVVDAGVTVSAPVNVGPVQAVSLTADTADAVQTWLASNGFSLTADGQAIVAAYAGTGRYFIAIRRSDTATTGAPTSIGLHYTLPGGHQKLSLGFARLGAAPTVAFTLWNVTAGASAPQAPFVPVLLTALDQPTLRQGRYADAVSAAVAAHDNQAFVLEGESDKTTLTGRGVGAGLLGLVDDGATITRMSTIVPAAALTTDATFGAYTGGFIPGTVYAERHRRGIRYLAAGLLPAFATLVVRRRRARRADARQ
jgi:uncharacterized protein DUF2330